MSSPLDSSLRRSCDRCHEQKVRCIRDSTQLEEATAPCIRCRKAGAICLYSPQLRAGRRPACKRSRQTTTVPEPDMSEPGTQTDDDPFSPSAFLTDLEASELVFEEGPIPLLAPEQPQSHSHEETTDLEYHTTSIDQVDSELKELGELARRIYRSAHAFSSSSLPGIYPLSVSSPAIHELCDAAFALTRRIPNICLVLSNFDEPCWSPGPSLSPSWDDSQCSWLACSHTLNDAPSWRSASSLDAGLVLMVLACHQRLMSAFENVSLSVTRLLFGPTTMNPTAQAHSSLLYHHHVPPHPRRAPESLTTGIYDARVCSPPQSTQALLIVELLDHLLDQLDSAFRPLLPRDETSKLTPEPSSEHDSPVPSSNYATVRKDSTVTHQQVSLCVETARSVMDTMHHRHSQLRGKLNDIRRRIKDPKYHRV